MQNTSCNFQKTAPQNNWPMGENSPNMVTLAQADVGRQILGMGLWSSELVFRTLIKKNCDIHSSKGSAPR
jgi:hypothetical protein